MLSRFVLWEKEPSCQVFSGSGAPLLREAFAALAQGRTELSEFPKETLLAIRQRLADTLMGAEVVLRVVDGTPTLCLADVTPIVDLELSVRSFNCFKAASIETLEELLDWSPERLMKLPNFGRKCLGEIALLLDRLGYGKFDENRPFKPIQRGMRWKHETAPLACLLDVRRLIVAEDMLDRFNNFGWRIVADCAVYHVSELAAMTGMEPNAIADFQEKLDWLWLRLPANLPLWIIQHADALQAAFHLELEQLGAGLTLREPVELIARPKVPARSLQEELCRLIPPRYDERKREIVVRLFGLSGGEATTLDELAAKQTPPMTRERVRQIALPVSSALQEEGRSWPQLARAVDILQTVAPCPVELATRLLMEQGVLESPMSPGLIVRLARRAGFRPDLEVKGDWLVLPKTMELLQSLLQAAGKLSGRWGVAYWPDVLASLDQEITWECKDLLDGVVWLDQSRLYAVLPARENSLANRLARILKVTPRLKLLEAYQGAMRDARMVNTPLPREQFEAFCNVWPWCMVQGDELVAGEGIPPSEASSDDLLVLILREIGRPARRREITQEALKHGLTLGDVTHALSYSNVIVSSEGFFAVIGDGTLTAFAEGRLQPAPEPLVITPIRNDCHLIPDEHDPRFAPLLMAAVEMRMESLGLHAPWSVSELGLTSQDRDSLLAWGRNAVWNSAENTGFYELATKEKVSKRAALGLAFVMFAAEAVRRSDDTGGVWPAIETYLGDAQCRLFLVRSGVPKPMLRDAVETACRTFGLRHSFEDVGEVWVRTLGLQYGLQSGHVRRLSKMLSSYDIKPTSITLLLDKDSSNGSASFRNAWRLLQDVRRDRMTEIEALSMFAADSWLAPFGPEELLRHCRRPGEVEVQEDIREDLPYQYFSSPILRWEGMEPVLDYNLNPIPPSWRTSDVLTFIAEDPFRRERLTIANGRWALGDGALEIRITQRERAGFCFRLLHGKEAITDGWLEVELPLKHAFVFFRASGAMVPSPDDVPLNEEIVILHAASTRLAGLAAGTRFQMVLRGAFRLTRLRAGEVAQISLLSATGDVIWSCPHAEMLTRVSTRPLLLIRGGEWGQRVSVTLPVLPFVAESLRLNSGEFLPLASEGGRVTLLMSPGLAVAEVGYLRGAIGSERRSVPVELKHGGGSFGAALETSAGWHTLDGSATLDAVVLRTQRLRAHVVGSEQDVCWMEGSRTLCGLQHWGTTLSEVHGLGEKLKVVRGTYNESQVQMYAASAVTDHGFLRSVQFSPVEGWSATLPFEDELGPEHSLWVWSEGRLLPSQVPRELIEKTGFALRWQYPSSDRACGWAFSVNGARLGSVMSEDGMRSLTKLWNDAPWFEAATWLRWWHAPVHHSVVRSFIATQVREQPIDTVKAWLLRTGNGLVFDELRDEAWAAAARRFLWTWRPNPTQAVELVTLTGIWSGLIEQDAAQAPSSESLEALTRINPWLLAYAAEQALPVLYPYPKPQLAVLLKLTLEALNPNTVRPSFQLSDLYDRYARGESRLDGKFIAQSLVSAAKAMLHGQKITDSAEKNLQIALHQPGLRQLMAIAVLRDVMERWERA